MPHICKSEGCNYPVFSNLFCKYHQYLRKRQGGDLFVRKKPTIKNRTVKRARDEKYYAVLAKEFFEESDKICVFCGEKVTKYEGLHHWKGRTNNYLLDKRWWSTVHNSCHLFYHRATVERIKAMTWYREWLSRLKLIDESLYQKQIGKEQKELNLFDD